MYPISPDQAWANLDRDLRGYFDFTEDDLAANQRGEISQCPQPHSMGLIPSISRMV